MKDRTIYAADVFAGCGGLSLGLSNAGLKVCIGIDIDARVQSTYSANHPNVKFVLRDIRNISGTDLIESSRKRRIDVLAGCAPCQGFTSLTKKYRREDPRNLLVLEMARLVEEVEPSIVVMENVPGLTQSGQALFDEFLVRLRAVGYYTNWKLLQMADYGVPQNRRRLVLVAGRGFFVPLPMPTHARIPTNEKDAWICLRDAIGHFRAPRKLSDVKRGGGPQLANWHVVRDLKPVTKARLRAAVPGKGWQNVPELLRPECHQGDYVGFTNVYQRMTWDQLPVTTTSGCTIPAKGRFGHPDRRRTTISVREAATLQTFPEDYEFATEHIDHACDMIGNAVPPAFGEHLGRTVASTFRSHVSATSR